MTRESITAANQFLALLQTQIDSQIVPGELIDSLQGLVDSYSEAGLLGIADALALFAEQLEQLEQIEELAEQRVLLIDFSQALGELIHQPQAGVWQYLLACLSDTHWPEPLEAEDCDFLADLLEQDCQTLIDCVLESTPVTESVSGQDLPESSGSSLAAGWGEQLAQLSSLETESGVEQLHLLVEISGDAGYAGFADLFALLAEQWESESDNPERLELLKRACELLQSLQVEDAECLLALMSDLRWIEPLPEDDRQFLLELLLPDLQQLDAIETELQSDDIQTVKTEAEQASPLPTTASFCDVDLALLQQPGPQLEPAVLQMLTDSLQGLLDNWQTLGESEENADKLLSAIAQQLEPVTRALNSVHLLGAAAITQGIATNICWLLSNPQSFQSQLQLQIRELLAELIKYLTDITDPERQQVLKDQLEALQLPAKPTEEQISYIGGLLSLASLQTLETLEREEAVAADVALKVADDIDPQLLEMLFNELPMLSEQLSEQLLLMVNAADVEAIREAQRAAHTIKGLANMAGVSGIANLTHRLEDILELFTDAEKIPPKRLSDDLIAITDTIAVMCESVVDQGAAPENACATLQLVMDWHYRLRSEGLDLPAATEVTLERQPEEDAAVLSGERQTLENEPESPLQPAENSNREQTFFRVPQASLDSLMRLAGEGTTLNTQLDEEISQLRSSVRLSRDRQRALQRVLFELEQQLNEYYTLQPGLDQDSEAFDPLEMDRYNEMHTSLSRLQEAVADIHEVEQQMDRHIRRTSELHIAQNGVQKETLERVLSTRMVEVKSITARLQRVLRQACRTTGKQAELIIEGEATLVDSHILNQLADPLMHIVRNAVDHGLETPDVRTSLNKPQQGRVVLRFWLENDLIRVTCGDDGAGIDTGRIREVAQQRGLIEPAIELTKREIERLILIPGFSTRDEISQLSGRGIGMDVVHQQIMRLQGNLDIRSDQGLGTTLELSMPSSSLMIKTLLVRAGKQIYALASHGLEQSLISLDGRLHDTAEGMRFESQGEHFPAYGLEALLGEHGKPYESGQVHPVLLVNLGPGEKVAIMVREVIAHRELAFKPMGDYLPDLPGIPGITILANGDTAPVIDLPARIRHKSVGNQNLFTPLALSDDLGLPNLLVVDDSLSARTSLATLLRDTGYEVNTAIDGLDAMNQIRKKRPDLVLTDLEMPRMGGMELTSMIRGREEIDSIPVLMITSRTTTRHRAEATSAGVNSFLTKPWTENMLLDNVRTLLQPENPIA
ncbi:hybrid sensor histidine kinase/response regulator [Amphritea japonica]|uniref:Chemotaxis protein CheA n=1 Tax=Amphritea japonica ATCC BAA-1530 TaxID=1278309 RepID=A0A7R6PED4_9GAMM|nr:response regulator [Amphritea japonica]BBB27923.1 two-component system sensor histidine kinase and response regulator [Amphritea japonica ATCC BAA-1530]